MFEGDVLDGNAHMCGFECVQMWGGRSGTSKIYKNASMSLLIRKAIGITVWLVASSPGIPDKMCCRM